MYSDYFLEEYGRETISNEFGFVMYFLNKEAGEVFITDLYTKPEYRKTYEAKKLTQAVVDIAKEHGCKIVTTIVDVGRKDPERTTKLLRCYLSRGFKVYKSNNDQILLGMEV
jgi:ribosomal protein S18 acetylase RimI-like enzyme